MAESSGDEPADFSAHLLSDKDALLSTWETACISPRASLGTSPEVPSSSTLHASSRGVVNLEWKSTLASIEEGGVAFDRFQNPFLFSREIIEDSTLMHFIIPSPALDPSLKPLTEPISQIPIGHQPLFLLGPGNLPISTHPDLPISAHSDLPIALPHLSSCSVTSLVPLVNCIPDPSLSQSQSLATFHIHSKTSSPISPPLILSNSPHTSSQKLSPSSPIHNQFSLTPPWLEITPHCPISSNSAPHHKIKPILNYIPSTDPSIVSRKGKKLGKSKKTRGIKPPFACVDSPVFFIEDYEISDDNIRHRNLVLLREAMLTLEVSKSLGLTPIEDEGRIVRMLMSLEEEEMANSGT